MVERTTHTNTLNGMLQRKHSGQPHKRDHRNRSRAFTYSKLGIDKKLQKSEHARGIYFGELFTNTREFLREEIKEDKLIRKFDNSVEALDRFMEEQVC